MLRYALAEPVLSAVEGARATPTFAEASAGRQHDTAAHIKASCNFFFCFNQSLFHQSPQRTSICSRRLFHLLPPHPILSTEIINQFLLLLSGLFRSCTIPCPTLPVRQAGGRRELNSITYKFLLLREQLLPLTPRQPHADRLPEMTQVILCHPPRKIDLILREERFLPQNSCDLFYIVITLWLFCLHINDDPLDEAFAERSFYKATNRYKNSLRNPIGKPVSDSPLPGIENDRGVHVPIVAHFLLTHFY